MNESDELNISSVKDELQQARKNEKNLHDLLRNISMDTSLSNLPFEKIKDEIRAAKQFEQDLIARQTKALELEEIKRLEDERGSRLSPSAKRQLKLKKMQLEKELKEGLRQARARATETEQAKLQEAAENLINYEKEELSRSREEYHKIEEKNQEQMQRELDNIERYKYEEEKKNAIKLDNKIKKVVEKNFGPGSSFSQVHSPSSSPNKSSFKNTSEIQDQRLSSSSFKDGFVKSPKDRKTILLMTVDIGEGKNDTIQVKEGDDPWELAVDFARRNGLADKVIEPLTEHLKMNIVAFEPPSSDGHEETKRNLDETFERLSQPTQRWTQGADPRSFTPRINQNSKKMAFSGNSEKSVFDRLHNESLHHKNHSFKEVDDHKNSKTGLSSESKKLVQNRQPGSSHSNYGELLYAEGMRKMSQKQSSESEYNDQVHLDPEATFRPQISGLARKIQKGSVFNYKQKLQARDRQLQQEKELYTDQYDFQPEVNEKSKKLGTRGNNRLSTFDQLYLDADRRKYKFDEYEKISLEDHQQNQSTRRQSKEGMQEFLKRLAQSSAKREKSMEQLRQEYNRNIDPETGQEYFKPKLIAQYYGNKEMEEDPERNKWNSLYNSHSQMNASKQQIRAENEQQIKEMARKPTTNKQSRLLVEETKKRKTKMLFDFLVQDNDEKLIPNEIDLSELDPNLSKELLLAFNDTEDKGCAPVTFEEFYKALNHRMNQNPVARINILSLITNLSNKG
eukprot:gb/GECH01009303.1/.p1 GENE.gb/GECH01009303.1/~~gb/GECH01009303.1/.p1  ORF type:complete len:736 (+),score=216.59 gb/GECH01009303.1/:1-2208(+)